MVRPGILREILKLRREIIEIRDSLLEDGIPEMRETVEHEIWTSLMEARRSMRRAI